MRLAALDKEQNATPLQRISGLLLASVPTDLTISETSAIQKGSIYRGMSRGAPECALGFPKKENDWGQGGKQLIFTDTLYVYVNREDRVVDWQSMDR
jgi:hypothetical protein